MGIELLGEVQPTSFEVIPVTLPGTESHYSLVLFDQPSVARSEPRPAGILPRLWQSLVGEGAAVETGKDNRACTLAARTQRYPGPPPNDH